jgi:hypothetical protein
VGHELRLRDPTAAIPLRAALRESLIGGTDSAYTPRPWPRSRYDSRRTPPTDSASPPPPRCAASAPSSRRSRSAWPKVAGVD